MVEGSGDSSAYGEFRGMGSGDHGALLRQNLADWVGDVGRAVAKIRLFVSVTTG